MNYTSPNPPNVAFNGNKTVWYIPAKNISSLTATNVKVNVVVSPASGLQLETWQSDKGAFDILSGIWMIGTLQPGETQYLKIVTKVVDIDLAPFTITSIISGNQIDPNNTNNTNTQTVSAIFSPPTAGAVPDVNQPSHIDVSLNDQACNYGDTEWRLNVSSLANCNNYVWDVTKGQGHFIHVNPTLPITGLYSIWCDPGTGFVEISSGASFSIDPLYDSNSIFNHSLGKIEGSDLTPDQIATFKTQDEYSQLTDDEIKYYTWKVLYNSEGVVVGGWAFDTNPEQDTRTFFECSDTPCTDIENPCPSCPQGDMPEDVLLAISNYTNYTKEKGDTIYVQHTDGYAIYKWNGDQWLKWGCKCVYNISQDDDNDLTLGEDNEPYFDLTTINEFIEVQNKVVKAIEVTGTNEKTITLTFEDNTTITASFTDLTGGPSEQVSELGTPKYIGGTPGQVGLTYDISTLFTEPIPVGATWTFEIAGYPPSVYENVSISGNILTYSIKSGAPSGTHPFDINRIITL